jgi:predicted small lipoprotein YifL
MSAPRKFLITLTLIVMTILSGCGQKGDLYHPEEQQSALAHIGAMV